MKSFKIIRENMAAAGIDSHLSNQKCPFNVKNVTILSAMMVGEITTIVYVFCEADSFDLYVDAAYIISTIFACGSIFVNFILVTTKVNIFLSSFENTIIESKKWHIVWVLTQISGSLCLKPGTMALRHNSLRLE